MATDDSTRVYETSTIDPNFSLPPDVRDLQYLNIDEAGDSDTTRSNSTGEVVSVEYDEVSYGEMQEDTSDTDTGGAEVDTLYPPDSITLVSQTVRIGSDGRAVVDVVLEVDGNLAGVTYDVRVTKT